MSFEERFPNAKEIDCFIAVVTSKGRKTIQHYFNVPNYLLKNRILHRNQKCVLRVYTYDEKESI